MKTTPSIFDDIIQSLFSAFPLVDYLCVFHDSLSQSTEGSATQKTSTLKTINNIQGLFECLNFSSEKGKNILIEGDTGIGKTTLCKEICYQWAKNNLFTNSKLVLLLLLHDPNVQKISSVHQLVDYFSASSITKDALLEYFQNRCGAGITIILDGYNQLSVEQQKNSFLRDLIEGKRLVKSQVIVTSQPSASQCFCNCLDRRIELLELAKYYKQKFILTSLKNNPSKLKLLWKHLLLYPKIELLTHTPINITIMMSLCLNFDCPLPTTATKMYEMFILYVIRHQTNYLADEIEDFPQSVLDIVKQIEYFAYESLINKKETFQETDLPDVCKKGLTCFGLMQCIKYYSPLDEHEVRIFNFLHHGIQEYLAARYIAGLPNNEILKLTKFVLPFPDTPTNLNKKSSNMWTFAFDIMNVKSGISLLHQKSFNTDRKGIWQLISCTTS